MQIRNMAAVGWLAVLVASTGIWWAVPASAITPQADLSLTVLDSVDPINAGTTQTYTITPTNSGPSPDPGVKVTITLPLSMIFRSIAPASQCAVAGQVIRCEGPDDGFPGFELSNGQSASFTLTADVDPLARINISPLFSIAGGQTDPDTSDNTPVQPSTVTTDVNLQVSQVSVNPTTAIAGDILTYTFAITNTGRSAATLVEVEDIFPPTQIAEFIDGTAGFNCTGSAASATCALGIVAPAGVTRAGWIASGSTFALRVRPRTDLALTDTLINVTSVEAIEADSAPGNNVSARIMGVTRRAALRVVAAGPSQVTSGATATYTLGVSNLGPSINTGVALTIGYPASVTVTSATVPNATCTIAATQTVCQLGTMAFNGAATVTLATTLRSTRGAAPTISAALTGDAPQPDGAVNQRSVTLTTTIAGNTRALPLLGR